MMKRMIGPEGLLLLLAECNRRNSRKRRKRMIGQKQGPAE
jgi:hypothetical protein